MKVYNCVFQVTQTYPVTEDNFEITYSGQLILNMPPNGVPPNQTLSDNAAAFSSEENLKAIATTPGYDEEFQKTIERVAKGREVETIKLFKPENMSLGFSVVGLKGENNEETGIFVQDIQPGGIAARSVTLVNSLLYYCMYFRNIIYGKLSFWYKLTTDISKLIIKNSLVLTQFLKLFDN